MKYIESLLTSPAHESIVYLDYYDGPLTCLLWDDQVVCLDAVYWNTDDDKRLYAAIPLGTLVSDIPIHEIFDRLLGYEPQVRSGLMQPDSQLIQVIMNRIHAIEATYEPDCLVAYDIGANECKSLSSTAIGLKTTVAELKGRYQETLRVLLEDMQQE